MSGIERPWCRDRRRWQRHRHRHWHLHRLPEIHDLFDLFQSASASGRISASWRLIGPQCLRNTRRPMAAASAAKAGHVLHRR